MCIICGKEFRGSANQKLCSKDCAHLRHKGFQRCPVCGNLFYNRVKKRCKGKRKSEAFDKRRMYCSEKCKRFAANVRKREKYKNDENYRNNVKRSIKKYNASEVGKDKLQANKLKRDRRIKNGSKIDYITLRQLFKRDNGICWLCGKKTPIPFGNYV